MENISFKDFYESIKIYGGDQAAEYYFNEEYNKNILYFLHYNINCQAFRDEEKSKDLIASVNNRLSNKRRN